MAGTSPAMTPRRSFNAIEIRSASDSEWISTMTLPTLPAASGVARLWSRIEADNADFRRMSMKEYAVATALLVVAWLATGGSTAEAAPCLIVTLTGTQGGPQSFRGLAGAGTLVRYGDDQNECAAVKLQFDTGRGTTMRLSQLGIGPEQ